MKRHLTASAASLGRRNEGRAMGGVTNRTRTAFAENTRTQPASSEQSLVLASVSAWTHTLVLTGELNYRSAHTLEAEIERLCEEGVTGITLDLRQLTHIDPVGVAVIAFRCRLCERRGYDFALIPGSRFMRRAFEQAGVSNLLAFGEEDVAAPRRPALVLGHRSREGCEA
jgi:anti-anti-sigma factor